MAGVPGTTLTDELNRLAQGGTNGYDRSKYLQATGAANKWAGTTGLALVGALNAKAGTSASALELRGVCNKLASTSDLDPVTALRTIAS